MRGKVLSAAFCFLILVFCGVSLTACGVVPCAWIKLDMEGYVYYSTYMYPGSNAHISYYESEEAYEEEQTSFTETYLLKITFFPRILGPGEFDGEKVTTVDVGDKYCRMEVTINKQNGYYDANKKVYLNDEALTPTDTYDCEYFVQYGFDNFKPVRGNPNGQFNHFINKIAYK